MEPILRLGVAAGEASVLHFARGQARRDDRDD